MRDDRIARGLAAATIVASGMGLVGCSAAGTTSDENPAVIEETVPADGTTTDGKDDGGRGWKQSDTLAEACERADVPTFTLPGTFSAAGTEFGSDVEYWSAGRWVMARFKSDGKAVLVTKWATSTHLGPVMGVAPSMAGMDRWSVIAGGRKYEFVGHDGTSVSVIEWDDEDQGMSYMVVSRYELEGGDLPMTNGEATALATQIR